MSKFNRNFFSKKQNGVQNGRQNCKFSQIFCILLILTGFSFMDNYKIALYHCNSCKKFNHEFFFQKFKMANNMAAKTVNIGNFYAFYWFLPDFFSWTTIKSCQISVLGAKNIIREFFFQNSTWRPIWPPNLLIYVILTQFNRI